MIIGSVAAINVFRIFSNDVLQAYLRSGVLLQRDFFYSTEGRGLPTIQSRTWEITETLETIVWIIL